MVVEDSFAGKEGRCPFCKTALIVPGSEDQIAAAGQAPEHPGPDISTSPPAWSSTPEPPTVQATAPQAAATPEAVQQPAVTPRKLTLPGGRWVKIGIAAVAALAILAPAAYYIPLWLTQNGERTVVRRPDVPKQPGRPVEPPKEPDKPAQPGKEPDKPPQPGKPAKPAEPAKPAKPARPQFPLTIEVAGRIPPSSIAYFEVPRPAAAVKALAKQRIWKDQAVAGGIISGGIEEMLYGLAESFTLSGDRFVAAAHQIESLHFCVVDWFPAPAWVAMARYAEPPTFEGLFGPDAEKLTAHKAREWQGITVVRLRARGNLYKLKLLAACCGRYLLVGSDELVMEQAIDAIQRPPAEGDFARQTMAQLPAFARALEARPANPDSLWAFVDMPRFVEQMMAAGRNQKTMPLFRLDEAVHLRKIAAIAASADIAAGPAMRLDVLLKGKHPLLEAFAGPPLKPGLPAAIPPDAAVVARFSVADPQAVWNVAGDAFDRIAPHLGIVPTRVRGEIRKHAGTAAWEKAPQALGTETVFFATTWPESGADVALLATIKDEAAFKAVADLAAEAPALKSLKMTEEDLGGIKLLHPEKSDTFPCYARIGPHVLMASRQALARSAISAHQKKAGPPAKAVKAAFDRLGEAPTAILMINPARSKLADKDLFDADGWMAIGAVIRPGRLTLAMSDPVPVVAMMNGLKHEAAKIEKRHLRQVTKNLREISKASVVAAAIEPQLMVYPRTFAELLENGKIKDTSIFLNPFDPKPTVRDGVKLSFEFIFEQVDARIKIEYPKACILAWDREPFLPGRRAVAYGNFRSEIVTEERFRELLEQTKAEALKHSAKTVKLP